MKIQCIAITDIALGRLLEYRKSKKILVMYNAGTMTCALSDDIYTLALGRAGAIGQASQASA